jgi:phospholipid/cholesterol/gamma-HCH transport system permease protein
VTHFATLRRAAELPLRGLETLGRQGVFWVRTVGWAVPTARRYRREVVRLIAEVGMGTGALAVIGGSAVIVGFMAFTVGGIAGVQGYGSLSDIGVGALAPVFAAFADTRLGTPAIGGIGLAITFGAGVTAQLGSMRINDEIDALDVMAVHSLRFLASTRLVAGFLVIVPVYTLALVLSYAGSYLAVVLFYGQAVGNYQHYFDTFFLPLDVLYSYLQALGMTAAIMLIHTYYGYHASGGPAGVGEAVGRSVRTSVSVVLVLNLLVAMAAYGGNAGFHLSG